MTSAPACGAQLCTVEKADEYEGICKALRAPVNVWLCRVHAAQCEEDGWTLTRVSIDTADTVHGLGEQVKPGGTS